MKDDQEERLDIDDLWSIARIDVLIENRSQRITKEEEEFYRRYSGQAFQDDEYPGILECQHQNYRADPDNF